MTLFLDRRIGSVELHPYLRTPHEVCELEFGDAVVLGVMGESDISIGIERKRLNDLLNSMMSGRLVAHQIPGMLETYDRCFVVVEGIWKTNERRELLRYAGGKFKRVQLGQRKFGSKDVHSFLLSIVEFFGQNLIFTSNTAHTAAWIDDIHYWYNKKKHRTAEVMMANPMRGGFVANILTKRPPRVALMAKGLDGIGGRKALDLAKRFGSMVELAAAGISDIMEVEGIGKTTAEAIWKQLREK